MKNNILSFKDFELETINKQAQKAIRGGDGEAAPITPPNNPEKGGGNGNG
ncbi:hypothetical protein [Flavobacterium sp. ACN6]|nr:hypothetical protein [Flavobacterium sp. ACN6]PBJ11346.1 hypothetical protein BSF42_27490 [Flavobacterium sp. ACN6]